MGFLDKIKDLFSDEEEVVETKEIEVEEKEEPTTKKCPYCLSEIDIHATRCPHCTSIIEDIDEINNTSNKIETSHE